MRVARLRHVLGFVAAASVLTSCVGTAGYVRYEPPVAQVEVIGVTPGPEFVWIPGFHRWTGSAFTWTPGHWGRPPRGRSRWEPGRWERHESHGWRYREGRWRR